VPAFRGLAVIRPGVEDGRGGRSFELDGGFVREPSEQSNHQRGIRIGGNLDVDRRADVDRRGQALDRRVRGHVVRLVIAIAVAVEYERHAGDLQPGLRRIRGRCCAAYGKK
jgi:hypothetical protein